MGGFVGAGAVVQGVELIPESLVPPAIAVLCREHVIRFVSATSPQDREFMEKVVAANEVLVEGYIDLDRSNLKPTVSQTGEKGV